MIKLVSKLGATSGLLTTAFVVDFSNVPPTQTRHDKADLENIDTKPRFEDVSSLEDIAIIEKAYGCAFGFVASWDNKKIYKAEEFVEQEITKTPEHWKERVIQGVKHENSKQSCIRKEKTALFNSENENGFVVDKPQDGW